jgi:hypothetical protein
VWRSRAISARHSTRIKRQPAHGHSVRAQATALRAVRSSSCSRWAWE